METQQTEEVAIDLNQLSVRDVVIKLNRISRKALLTRFKPEDSLLELLNTKPSDLHKLGMFGLRSYKTMIEILYKIYPESRSFPVYDISNFFKK